MAGARHFRRDQPTQEVRKEITAEATASRRAQRDAAAHGQHRLAETMRQGTDEALDELTALDAGTWTPKHA